jgi:hypothetical protein
MIRSKDEARIHACTAVNESTTRYSIEQYWHLARFHLSSMTLPYCLQCTYSRILRLCRKLTALIAKLANVGCHKHNNQCNLNDADISSASKQMMWNKIGCIFGFLVLNEWLLMKYLNQFCRGNGAATNVTSLCATSRAMAW